MLAMQLKEEKVCSDWMEGGRGEAVCQGWAGHGFCQKCSNKTMQEVQRFPWFVVRAGGLAVEGSLGGARGGKGGGLTPSIRLA